MRLLKLEILHFGKYHNKTITLSPGINIIEGRNEAGKSTIHSFIYAMLFGLEGSREKQLIYDKYLPWENMGGYGGEICFEEAGHEYRLCRSFQKNNSSISLTDITTGEELKDPEAGLSKLLGGITESGYRNSVSIRQMGGTSDENLAQQLRMNLTDLGKARNMELSIQKAANALAMKRRELENQLIYGVYEEENEHKAALYQLECELSEKLDRAYELEEQVKLGREKEYNEFSARQEERERLKTALEDVEQEHSRLVFEKERWEKEKENAGQKLGGGISMVTDMDLENNRFPCVLKPKFGLLFAAGAALIVFACVCASSYINLLNQGTEFIPCSLYFAMAAAVVGAAAVMAGFIQRKRYGRRREFFRLLVDKHMRLIEAGRALDAVLNRRTQLISQMSEEADSDYYRLHEENDQLEKDVMRLEWEQEQLVGKVDEEKEKLALSHEKCEKNRKVEMEIAAVRMAQEKLFCAADDIQASFGDEMIKHAGQILYNITDKAYTGIRCDTDDNVALISPQREVPLSSVSRGTIEQVYLCLRLAAADSLCPEVKLPFILDDTFAFYDDTRTRQALKILRHSTHQVIIMTCQNREKRLLDA